MGTLGPAAARSSVARRVMLALIDAVACRTHPTGSRLLAHIVTSLPPIETVTSATLPAWARRNASAAAAWVRPAVSGPPRARAPAGQLVAWRIDVVVAPP